MHNLAPARNSSVYRRQRQSRRRTMIAAWCTLTLPAVAPIAESRTCGHLTRCSSCSSSCTTFGSERLPCKLNASQEAESQWPCPRGSVHGQQSQAPHGRVKRAGHQPPPREHAQRRVCTVYSPTTQARSSAAGLLGLMWCKNRTSCHAWMDWPTTTTYQRRQARPWHRTKHRSQRHTAAWPCCNAMGEGNGICAAALPSTNATVSSLSCELRQQCYAMCLAARVHKSGRDRLL